jgi:hypothetical protein
MYTFLWSPVLNETYGTLGPYNAIVKVDGLRGNVVAYHVPRTMTYNAPTEPRISLERARRIAARFATYDPAKLPLIHPTLRVGETPYGVYYLSWKFYQVFHPEDEATIIEGGFSAEVDAITGDGRPSPGWFGAPADPKYLNKHRAAPPEYKGVVVQSADRKTLAARGCAEIVKDKVWIRAEVLRGIGAQVDVTQQSLNVAIDGRRLDEQALGAQYRDNGWWAPLREFQSAAAIRVDWVPEKKTAVIDRPLVVIKLANSNAAPH